MSGNEIESYNSITEAAKWLLDNKKTITIQSNSAITAVINGKLKHCYGYKWKLDESVTKSLVGEIWKEIPKHLTDDKSNYYVSNLGRFKDNKGYIRKFEEKENISIIIGKKENLLHRLILETFSPDLTGIKHRVIYKDKNKLNNKLDNLEWEIGQIFLNKDKPKPEINIKELQEDEEYREIIGYSNYEVSNYGNIRNKNTKQNIKQQLNIKGYNIIGLTNDEGERLTKSVHKFVALAFIPNLENKSTVNHKNKIKSDNKKDNLEWATSSEQNYHKNKDIKVNAKGKEIKIWSLDKNGNKIKYYPSIKDALIWLFNNGKTKQKDLNKFVKSSNISFVLKGDKKTAYGYGWKYDESVKESLEGEIWKEIPLNLTGDIKGYFVSNFGRYKNNKGNIQNFRDDNRYVDITINNVLYQFHRLVLLTFEPNENSDNLVVNHKDGNIKNNRLNNLEWTTSSGNTQHAYDTGLNSKNCKKVIQYDLKMNEINRYNSINEAARQANVNKKTVKASCEGITKNPKKFILGIYKFILFSKKRK